MRYSIKTLIALLLLPILILIILPACGSSNKDKCDLESWNGDPIVKTIYGEVQGFEDEANTWIWKAIPYAKPPVDELRWKSPQNPDPWEGVRAETEFCSECSQPVWASSEDGGSEDCLYLNVWRPQTKETNLPVYVFIHGGSNVTGSANMEGREGANLASKSNMVFVSMNYRLGLFGRLSHPALRSDKPGDELNDSGNYYILDLIQSLKWIQDNIEAFGGNPDNVIITGYSAGAENVWILLMSPVAEGLFHKAMCQSGLTSGDSQSQTEEFANDLLLNLLVDDGTTANHSQAQAYLDNMSDDQIETYLRSKSIHEILACHKAVYSSIIVPPVHVDGVVIPDTVSYKIATGTYANKVPIMVGCTKEESKFWNLFGGEGLPDDEELYQTVASYTSDFRKAIHVDSWARQLTSQPDQPPVYVYRFGWGAPDEEGNSPLPDSLGIITGACHGIDIPFYLGNDSSLGFSHLYTEENRPGREALSDAIMTYVAQFTRTGNPNKSNFGLPEWKPWSNTSGEPKYIQFNVDGDTIDIEMLTVELTPKGVLSKAQSELDEQLYSQVFESITSDLIWTSHVLKDMDLEPYTPITTPPEPTSTPEPAESTQSSATSVYNVHYEYEDTIEETVWTINTIGEESVDDIDCYFNEYSFDAKPQRNRFVAQLDMNMDIVTDNELVWVDAITLQQVKRESSTTQIGMTVATTNSYTHEGNHGAPFSKGQTWTYTLTATPQIGEPEISIWNTEVVGTEEITVPAGTFDCYKVLHTRDTGNTITEWWSLDGNYPAAIYIIDEATWNGTEIREIASYTEYEAAIEIISPEVIPEPTIEPTHDPILAPEPADTTKTGAASVYNVHFEYGDITEDTVWTKTTIGEETLNGVECSITETTYDVNPERRVYMKEYDQEFPITIIGATSWKDKQTLMAVKTVSSVESFGIQANSTDTFSYNGVYGVPFSVGNQWAIEITNTPSIGVPVTYTIQAEVVGIEEVTVPAGIFDCYKLVYSNDSGPTRTEWWPANDEYSVAVKMIYGDNIEIHELVAYTK